MNKIKLSAMCFILSWMLIGAALAQAATNEAAGSDEQASLWGGTGLVFTRTALLLPQKQLNFGGYFLYSHYQYLQGSDGNLDDPRKDDYDFHLVANYGLTPYLELGMFMDFFLDNERNDASQFEMRQAGLAWSGLNAKVRLLDVSKYNLGVALTGYVIFPSPQNDALLTSQDVGYGAEINVTQRLGALTEALSKVAIHGNLGFGHFDYFNTGLCATAYRYIDDPGWDFDMLRDEDVWTSENHYTGSLAVDYTPMANLRLGLELVGYSTIDNDDENLMLAPSASYVMDEFSFTLAGNIGMGSNNRSAPEYGVVAGVTYRPNWKF